jgi:hypothetical protein
VDSHEREGQVVGSDALPSEHDEAILDKLRALGYLDN